MIYWIRLERFQTHHLLIFKVNLYLVMCFYSGSLIQNFSYCYVHSHAAGCSANFSEHYLFLPWKSSLIIEYIYIPYPMFYNYWVIYAFFFFYFDVHILSKFFYSLSPFFLKKKKKTRTRIFKLNFPATPCEWVFFSGSPDEHP